MLKTQITGAKYLSPQTNQMTNLNIAVPADSKDTEFGTSDILLAKDVVAYLNALDSDISNELATQTDKINKINQSIKQLIDHNLIKIVTELPTTDIDKNCIYLVPNKDGEGNNVFIEYIYVESKNTFEEVGRIQAKVDLSDYYTKEETDNQIQIAKNSAINIHNEDNTKSIKLDINDTEAEDDYGSPVNVSLTDSDSGYTININAVDGFTHINSEGHMIYLSDNHLNIDDETCNTGIYSDHILMYNNDTYGNIRISVDKPNITIYEPNSTLETSLSSYGIKLVNHKTKEIQVQLGDTLNCWKYNNEVACAIWPTKYMLQLGGSFSTPRFSITAKDTTKGATITGVESITAFFNLSATEVWATDGSTVDLTTKANTSDVLLKKSASGGYYIEANDNQLGSNAFAANSKCTASGNYSHAEGGGTKAQRNFAHSEGNATVANGMCSHAEGSATKAQGDSAHAEGNATKALDDHSHAEGKNTTASGPRSHAEGIYTNASGYNSHTEGDNTIASGYCSHAQGCYNIENINAIHSVGIGNNTTRKNAEYIYAKNNENGYGFIDDPKNGYKYLIGVGGYDGISTDNTTYKSVQEVIADLTSRIEQLETKVRALEAANTPA